MAKYIFKRLGMAVLTLWVIITITFILMHSVPGDPFSDEKMIRPEIMANLEARYGLDQPMIVQYFTYLGNVLQGDFGESMKYQNRTVNELIAAGFPQSFTLGIVACVMGLSLGIIFGIIAGLNRGKWPDYVVIILSILGVSVPSFVFASLFQYIFGAKLGWFPIQGWGSLATMVLPACALGLRMVAYIGRMMRTTMLDVLSQDYIRTSKAKGLSQFQTTFRHALRNAITPIVTIAGPMLAGTMVGSFVVENIFNIQGIGKYLVDSVQASDYTMILGMTTFYAILLVVMMLVVDILYVFVDPRVELN